MAVLMIGSVKVEAHKKASGLLAVFIAGKEVGEVKTLSRVSYVASTGRKHSAQVSAIRDVVNATLWRPSLF